jgi:hypothetical protein
MFRDFSQEAKEKLISYVNDTSSDGIWQIIKNSIDYMDVKIPEHFLHRKKKKAWG